MPLDDLKKLADALLGLYERAWEENAALRLIIESVTMPDGTKGIPGYEEKIEEWLANAEVREVTRQKFAPLSARIQLVQKESEVLELLRQLPPTGSVQ